MEYMVYGSKGIPFIYFPTEYNRFYEAGDKDLISTLSYYIETNKLFVIAVDSLDSLTLLNKSVNKRDILLKQESYYNYIVNELYPTLAKEYDFTCLPICLGISYGAFEAMTFLIRQPKLFGGAFLMSGIYKITTYIDDYYDELAFLNCPIDSINLLKDSEYINILRTKKILAVVSSAIDEEKSLKETVALENSLKAKGIPAEIYYWTNNYPHNWSSWKVYLDYYIKIFLK